MKSIKHYWSEAYTPIDLISMSILRYARTHPFGNSGILSGILSKLFPRLRFRNKRLKGAKACIDPSDFSHLKITDEFIFEDIYDLNKISFTPEIIIDCGGHIGFFTTLAKSCYPQSQVFIFEPNPVNIPFIEQHIKINNFDKVIIEQAAVSDYDGEIGFKNDEASFGGRITLANETPGIQVRVKNLISFIQNLKCKSLLLKMDIEGEEKSLLPQVAEVLPPNTFIFFETHDGISEFEKLKNKLNSFGFEIEISRITDDKYIDAYARRFQ